MTALTLGFIPLTDCAPLIVAQDRGLFAAEGLDVALSREASWATIRDKVMVGALDAAHMLAPMALAATAGVGEPAAPMLAPLAL
ncbi:MAG: ABC transporter substrate-binding protein, partial [Pseudomonadota bacterium]